VPFSRSRMKREQNKEMALLVSDVFQLIRQDPTDSDIALASHRRILLHSTWPVYKS
jgi:hypothetical protein